MNRYLLLMVLFVTLAIGCSSKPTKKDEEVTDSTEGKIVEVPPEDDFLNKDVEIEELSSADQFENQAIGEPSSSTIDSSVAADIAEAKNHVAANNAEAAAKVLASAVDAPNGGFLAAYNLGVIRERQGKYDKAANRYYQALQKNADFTPALENLVRLYLKNGRAADADRLVNKFSNSRPENLGHRAVGLHVLLFKKAYEDVIANAKRILRKDERHVGAMIGLAEANYRLGRYELAKNVIEGAIELQPERGELYNMAGLVDLELKDKAGALANFKEAVKKAPLFPEARNNLGVMYHEARDYNGAEAEFKAALRNFPGFKEAYLNLGNSYKGSGKYKDAELSFKRAIQLDDRYSDAHFNLGVLYLDSEVPGFDAIARFQKSIDSFATYKKVARTISKDDPADKYINEAKKQIEVERQKQQMLRESQKDDGNTE